MSDMVNHPHHYTYGGIETIDFLEAKSTPAEFAGYLRLNCLKYLSRAGRKGDVVEDYKKAAWYLNKLIGISDAERVDLHFGGGGCNQETGNEAGGANSAP
jgi:hypothetical protein